jgi:Mrp family chromosome partitioning ATPase
MSRNYQLLEQLDRERLSEASFRPVDDLPAAVIPNPNRGTRSHEEINKLVQGIFLSDPTPARRVVFTGASRGVGCTWICTNAAQVLSSRTTRDVCLVDTNEGSPGIAGQFNIPNDTGFVDSLADHESVRKFTWKVASNLWVMAAGGHPGSETVFSPERLEARLSDLSREFDFVLLDAAPVVAFSSGLAVASLADGAVLVLKAGQTPRRAVGLALKELETARAKVLGTVLNQRDYPIPEAIYQRL